MPRAQGADTGPFLPHASLSACRARPQGLTTNGFLFQSFTEITFWDDTRPDSFDTPYILHLLGGDGIEALECAAVYVGAI